MIERLTRVGHRIWDDIVRGHQPIVLMYHRVAQIDCDPWDLTVPPSLFEQQIAALVQMRTVVPLHQITTARSDKPLAAVTFDDGYRDVIDTALPILDRHDCPATLFLVTSLLESSRTFWWDELADLMLCYSTDRERRIALPALEVDFVLTPHQSPEDSLRQYRAVWKIMRERSSAERHDILDELADAFDHRRNDLGQHRLSAPEDFHKLQDTVMSIGAHTVSHPDLSSLDRQSQEHEILASRDHCRDLIGHAPRCFSYPFGQYDSNSIDIVSKAGFDLAVTVENKHVSRHSSPWEVPRRAVTASSIHHFERAFR